MPHTIPINLHQSFTNRSSNRLLSLINRSLSPIILITSHTISHAFPWKLQYSQQLPLIPVQIPCKLPADSRNSWNGKLPCKWPSNLLSKRPCKFPCKRSSKCPVQSSIQMPAPTNACANIRAIFMQIPPVQILSKQQCKYLCKSSANGQQTAVKTRS